MAKVAVNGSDIVQSTAYSHLNTERYEITGYDYWGYPYYGWVSGYTANATINGTIQSGDVSSVFVNGKGIIVNGDNTIESDTYNLGSNERLNGGGNVHINNTNGRVSSGNNNSVFAGGKSVAIRGSNVTTHANNTTTIGNTNLATNVYIGGD